MGRYAAKEGSSSDSAKPELFLISFDQMLKGAFHERNGRRIRQFGVTVRGSTMLVTSGDTVDRETYEALLAAKAIPLMGEPKQDTRGEA